MPPTCCRLTSARIIERYTVRPSRATNAKVVAVASQIGACFRLTMARLRSTNRDCNGDATVTADKDAVILLRYMLGIRGAALIAVVPLGPLCADVTAVETHFGTSAQYDVFGQPSTPAVAMQDGLVLLRLIQGVPDGALLNGIAPPAGATFTTGSTVRGNVNARCGTSY